MGDRQRTTLRDKKEMRQKSIDMEKAELQCLEACLAQGFTLQDYVESKRHLIEILESLNG